jgi:hypothetical protein
MIDRLHSFLDRPLDPSAARAIFAFASTILVGFAALFILAAREPEQPTPGDHPSAAAPSPTPAAPTQAVEDSSGEGKPETRRQDPQDVEGSSAARRAGRALRSHRAIQHVPYRRGDLAITLAGARGRRAVLRVSAPNLLAARRGWRVFLRRFRDRGSAYLPYFAVGAMGTAK